MKTYLPVLNVYIIWHPDAVEQCKPLADEIFTLLNRHPDRAFARGMGIPVYFRCCNQTQEKKPISLDLNAAEHSVIFVLVEAHLVCDSNWAEYLAKLSTQSLQSEKHLFVPIALTDSAFNLHEDISQTNYVRLFEKPLEQQQTLHFHVLHILSRLLENRVRQTKADITFSPMPIKLFISHTKRNEASLELAEAIKQQLDNSSVSRFFDSVDIAPAYNFLDEIKGNIEQSALLAIRTDQYTESPWCRLEIMEAKRQQRPIIVVDALQNREARSFPGLANLPGIRFDASGDLNSEESQFRLKSVINFALQEVLRFCYTREHLENLQSVLNLPEQSQLLYRAPEERDMQKAQSENKQAVIYPDPPLGYDENIELQVYNIPLYTPTTSQGSSLKGQRIGLSISDPDTDELNRLGLSQQHLKNAMVEVARQLLVQGVDLVYGGHLGANGYTETLMGLVRYHNDAQVKQVEKLTNYLAWPLWSTLDINWQAKNKNVINIVKTDAPADLKQSGVIEELPKDSDINTIDSVIWARCLSTMRSQLIQNTDARILLGGKLSQYKGKYSGIVEEALLALQNQCPLFLLGGFGGATAAVIESLLGQKCECLTEAYQRSDKVYAKTMDSYNQHIKKDNLKLDPIDYNALNQILASFGLKGLNNGLIEAENQILFSTVNIEQMIWLIVTGLNRINNKQ